MRVPLAAVILVAEGAAAAGDGFDWSALATGRPLSLGPGGDGKVAEVADDEEGCLPPQQQGQQVAGGGGGATAAPYRPGRLRAGDTVGGFELTAFLRPIPLLPPGLSAHPPGLLPPAPGPTAVQVRGEPGASGGEELGLGLALPSQLTALGGGALPLALPAAHDAVTASLLALPAASVAPGAGTGVALASVQPALPSPRERADSEKQLARLSEAGGHRAPDGEPTAPAGIGYGVPGYSMGRRIGHGHHGEVWRAVRRQATSPGEASGPDDASGEPERYVLKRIFVERGADIRLAGLREVYFGDRVHSPLLSFSTTLIVFDRCRNPQL